MSIKRPAEMTQHQMFEASFSRPGNYFTRSSEEQWEIDKRLGILDWNGEDLTDEELERYRAHYASPN